MAHIPNIPNTHTPIPIEKPKFYLFFGYTHLHWNTSVEHNNVLFVMYTFNWYGTFNAENEREKKNQIPLSVCMWFSLENNAEMLDVHARSRNYFWWNYKTLVLLFFFLIKIHLFFFRSRLLSFLFSSLTLESSDRDDSRSVYENAITRLLAELVSFKLTNELRKFRCICCFFFSFFFWIHSFVERYCVRVCFTTSKFDVMWVFNDIEITCSEILCQKASIQQAKWFHHFHFNTHNISFAFAFTLNYISLCLQEINGNNISYNNCTKLSINYTGFWCFFAFIKFH